MELSNVNIYDDVFEYSTCVKVLARCSTILKHPLNIGNKNNRKKEFEWNGKQKHIMKIKETESCLRISNSKVATSFAH